MLMTAEDVIRTRLDELYPQPVPYIGKSMESDWQLQNRHDTAKRELKARIKSQRVLERKQRDFERLGYEREIMRRPRLDGPTAQQVISAVALVYNIPSETIKSKSRKFVETMARHHVAWELRYRKNWSLPRIGSLLDRDHTTITNSLQVVRKDRHRFEEQIKAVASMLDNTGENDDQDHSDSRGFRTDEHQCAC